MAKTRLEFQEFLETFKGDRNVYFQPPATIKMNYPAILYNLAMLKNIDANNSVYLQTTAYTLTYITDDPDDDMIKKISTLPLSRFDRWYAADNLNHYVYTVFY